jgi:hypothetical protein
MTNHSFQALFMGSVAGRAPEDDPALGLAEFVAYAHFIAS